MDKKRKTEKACIIIANGDLPAKSVINYLKKNGVDTIIAADGGANSAFKLGLVPDYIIGDFDSIKPEVQKYFSVHSDFIQYKRQNDTDVEKSLKFAVKKKFDVAYLLGGTGDRLDHTICNLGIVLKFFDKIKVVLIHGKTILCPYDEDVVLQTVPNETISLYAFDDKTFITSKGLKYPLKNCNLKFGEKESTSNVATGREVALNISGGKIFVIRNLNTVKKNGLLFQS